MSLGIAGGVGDGQTHDDTPSAGEAGQDIDGEQEGAPFASRQQPQQESRQDGDTLTHEDDVGSRSRNFVGAVRGDQDEDTGDCTRGHGQEESVEGVEAESGDDDGDEGVDGTSGDHAQEGHGEDDPEFLIHEQFEDVLSLEVRVADARIVHPQPCHGDVSFSLVESFGTDGIRRHEKQDHECPYDRQNAADDVHISPG